jgi:hypothetical protein
VYDISEINPHLGLWQSETYVSPSERAWLAWVAAAEKLIGHSLDGDETTDGYSLDGAYAAFEANLTAAEYVAEVIDAKAANDVAIEQAHERRQLGGW